MDQQAGMRLAGRPEVLLDPKMQFDTVTAEPASTAGGKDWRLGHLLEAQHPAVEPAQRVLAASWQAS
jgi:hypothetical protein